MNKLYYGDNLDILRRYIADESVDLVYLDPPFNSHADYNVLFAEHSGQSSAAQIKAFEDTWEWSIEVTRALEETIELGGTISETLQGFWKILGNSNMMAYLGMMAPRLVELYRVMRTTGSIYLHCDPTASHYLKILMDGIFGTENYRSEIVWKRSASHGGASNFHDVHDIIFYYTKSKQRTWNAQYQPYSEEYSQSHYPNADADGRKYQLVVAHGLGPGPPRNFGGKEILPPPVAIG